MREIGNYLFMCGDCVCVLFSPFICVCEVVAGFDGAGVFGAEGACEIGNYLIVCGDGLSVSFCAAICVCKVDAGFDGIGMFAPEGVLKIGD